MRLTKEHAIDWLSHALNEVATIDPSRHSIEGELDVDRNQRYDLRNELVHDAVFYARKAGYEAGYIIHDPITDLIRRADIEVRTPYVNFCSELKYPKWDKQWGVVAVINLPCGQVSWHMDSKELAYDGHSDDIKWKRVTAYVKEWRDNERVKSVSSGTQGL